MTAAVLTLTCLLLSSTEVPTDDRPAGVAAVKFQVLRNRDYSGVVTQITPNGITIEGMGTVPKGTGFETAKARGKRTFAPSATLRAGKHERHPPSFTYRWSDVRAGDWIVIGYDRLADGAEVCVSIRIERRPGGLVPPAPGHEEPYPGFPRYHERMNARQASEEKGNSIPGKFPSPAEAVAQEQRIAPMPRLVKPRGP